MIHYTRGKYSGTAYTYANTETISLQTSGSGETFSYSVNYVKNSDFSYADIDISGIGQIEYIEAGYDTIYGEDGDDMLNGGSHADTFVFSASADTIFSLDSGTTIPLEGITGVSDVSTLFDSYIL